MSRYLDRYTAAPPQDPQGEALDLRAYLAPVWRWKWVVAAITILAAGGTYALRVHEVKTYTATTRVLVQNANPAASVTASVAGGQVSNPPTPQSLQNDATLITSQANTTSVYHDLGLPIGPAGSVVATPETTSSVIDVTASSHSPSLAARLANTYVSVFLASQSQSVTAAANVDAAAARATLAALPGGSANLPERDALLTQIAEYNTIARSPTSGAQVPYSAVAPTSPSAPKPARDAAFAGVVGLLLAIGLAFILDAADRRLIRVSSVQSVYGRPVVAVLPHVAVADRSMSGSLTTPPEFVEVMRGLRVQLRLAAGGRSPKSVIVTSGLPSEGKSTVARDLALAHADAGERVLLVDCDLRRPSVGRMFGVDSEVGLVHVLRREVSPAEAVVTAFQTNPPSFNGPAAHAMSAGDPRVNGSISILTHGELVDSPAALLSSQSMTDLLGTASTLYDVVILDTSPVLTVSDAVPLLGQVAAVLFVARLGLTTREAAERLTELGDRIPNMNLVGVVVNDMRTRYVDEGYSYYSKYGYTYARPEKRRRLHRRNEHVDPRVPSGSPMPANARLPYAAPVPDAALLPYDAPAPVAPSTPHDPASPYDPAA